MKYIMLILFFLSLTGCCMDPVCKSLEGQGMGEGGGRDAITTDLPFASGYVTQCVQGTEEPYSHNYTSTKFDLDFDTPNTTDDLVYAPASGIAYVQRADEMTGKGFGLHVNIDLGDGTYILLAHLKTVFVESGSEVTKGQLLAFEGMTGNADGDHVHMGRHSGDAVRDATLGTSFDGLMITMADKTAGTPTTDVLTSRAICGIPGGHRYVSALPVPKWHPNGSLVKTPYSASVYLLENGTSRVFTNEDAFLTRGYDFDDVALISPAELACYGAGEPVSGSFPVGAMRSVSGKAWIFIGSPENAGHYKLKLPSLGWQGILKSYGIFASSWDDIDRGDEAVMASYPDRGLASYRDGALVSPADKSDVYVMTNGVAMPIESWDVFLLLGWEDRYVMELPEEEIAVAAPVKGNCAVGTYCLTAADVTSCGGTGESPPEEGAGDTGELGDTGGDEGVPLSTLSITWRTPGQIQADSISLSGEFISATAGSTGWQSNMVTSTHGSSVETEFLGVGPGDSYRFSVEYVVNGVKSWSCLAPFPPGTVTGVTDARLDGTPLPVNAVKDPMSDGCGLFVTVP